MSDYNGACSPWSNLPPAAYASRPNLLGVRQGVNPFRRAGDPNRVMPVSEGAFFDRINTLKDTGELLLSEPCSDNDFTTGFGFLGKNRQDHANTFVNELATLFEIKSGTGTVKHVFHERDSSIVYMSSKQMTTYAVKKFLHAPQKSNPLYGVDVSGD